MGADRDVIKDEANERNEERSEKMNNVNKTQE